MFQTYGALFKTPGGLKFSLAGLVGRMPISMDSLSLVFIVVAATNSYAIAGALSAVAAIVMSIAGPFWARSADRFGQRKTLLIVIPLRFLTFSIFVALVLNSAPIWSWFAAIIVAELTALNAGGMVRARWLHALSPDKTSTAEDQSDRHIVNTAYSYEGLMDEFVWIIGPIIATVCATSIAPSAGIIAGMAFMVIGLSALAAQKSSEPPPSPRNIKKPHAPVIRNRTVQAIVIPSALVGGFFGAIAIAVVGFMQTNNEASKTGLVLAIWGAGSAISAIINGVIKWKATPGALFISFLISLVLLSIPLLFVHSIFTLTLALFVNGFAIAPLIVNAYRVVEAAVPPQQITESLSWVVAGMPIGGALSSAIVGWAIDAHGAETAFWVPVGFVFAALLATLPYFSTYRGRIS